MVVLVVFTSISVGVILSCIVSTEVIHRAFDVDSLCVHQSYSVCYKLLEVGKWSYGQRQTYNLGYF